MARFDPKDYIEVKDRIVRFWEKYPNGAIETELLYADERMVRVKAQVFATREPDVKPVGSGHAEEVRITEEDIARDKKNTYAVNATSAVENCETSAVGRALAMAGFEVSKSVASRQEMEKVQRQQQAMQAKQETSDESLDNAKEPAKVGTMNGAQTPEKLNEDDARKLAGKIKATGMELSAVKLKLVSMGIESPATLVAALQECTKDQALDLYGWVQGETQTTGDTNAPSS